MLPLLLGRLSVQPRALEPLRAQTHVDLVLCIGASAEDLVHEATGMAFVEGGDHVGAIFTMLVKKAGGEAEGEVLFWFSTVCKWGCIVTRSSVCGGAD